MKKEDDYTQEGMIWGSRAGRILERTGRLKAVGSLIGGVTGSKLDDKEIKKMKKQIMSKVAQDTLVDHGQTFEKLAMLGRFSKVMSKFRTVMSTDKFDRIFIKALQDRSMGDFLSALSMEVKPEQLRKLLNIIKNEGRSYQGAFNDKASLMRLIKNLCDDRAILNYLKNASGKNGSLSTLVRKYMKSNNMSSAPKTEKSTLRGALAQSGAGLITGFGVLGANEALRAPGQTLQKKKAWDVVLKMKQSDPVLSRAPEDKLKSAFETIFKFAPDLAGDKNALKSILRTTTVSDGGIDYQTIKSLVDAQSTINKSMNRAGGNGQGLNNLF